VTGVVSGTPPSGMSVKLSSLQAAMMELASTAERTVGHFNDKVSVHRNIDLSCLYIGLDFMLRGQK